MLVSQHAMLSTLAALVAAPMVRNKANLGVFLAAAVGEDVDHYIWYAVKFRDPSLPRAYRFFRSQYDHPRRRRKSSGVRFLHGFAPLAAVSLAALGERRLVPVALGVAFHGFLDSLNEFVLMPLAVDRRQPGVGSGRVAEEGKVKEAATSGHLRERSEASVGQ